MRESASEDIWRQVGKRLAFGARGRDSARGPAMLRNLRSRARRRLWMLEEMGEPCLRPDREDILREEEPLASRFDDGVNIPLLCGRL
jgi:hypothetical protein